MADFSRQIAAFVQQTQNAMTGASQDTIISTGNELVDRSPVKTGRFKGNWQFGNGSAPNSSLNTFDGDGSSTKAAIATDVRKFKAGEVGYLGNNITYGYDIEFIPEYSKQAPEGVVRVTFLNIIDHFNAAVQKNKLK
jgi:hypothetical protein